MTRATDRVLTEVIFDWSPNPGLCSGTCFRPCSRTTSCGSGSGRHSGVVPYFFPAAFALACFLWPRARREWWQWMVCAVALTEILVLIIWIPYNYFGGAGVLGNRYFMNFYGAFLFLLPPITSVAAAFVPWIVGGALHGADRAQPVLLLLEAAAAHEARAAALAARRADAGQRPADQHGRRARARALRHDAALPDLLPRRQRLRRRSRSSSGCAARRARTCSSRRPTPSAA